MSFLSLSFSRWTHHIHFHSCHRQASCFSISLFFSHCSILMHADAASRDRQRSLPASHCCCSESVEKKDIAKNHHFCWTKNRFQSFQKKTQIDPMFSSLKTCQSFVYSMCLSRSMQILVMIQSRWVIVFSFFLLILVFTRFVIGQSHCILLSVMSI